MPSLSACGLPTPVVAFSCIGNVDIQVFSCADGESYFLRRLQAGGGVHPRSILSRAAMSKPSGGIARTSLSAWGLPTPVVAFSCIGNVDIQVFSCADGESYFLRRLQAGGGVHPRSILSRAAMSKPSGGIARCPRCPPGACQRRLLPLPVLVMLIFKSFLVQVGDFISYGVCKLAFPSLP